MRWRGEEGWGLAARAARSATGLEMVQSSRLPIVTCSGVGIEGRSAVGMQSRPDAEQRVGHQFSHFFIVRAVEVVSKGRGMGMQPGVGEGERGR